MKLAVLLLNLGGPCALEEIEPFLFNLFSDPDTLPIPFSQFFQKPLARFIARQRKNLSQSYYRAIGGGSPLQKITHDQARALELRLKRHFNDVKVYVAMRYSKPRAKEAWEWIIQDQRTHLVILPLYPQYSMATTGSSYKELKAVMENKKYSIESQMIEFWHNHPLYIESFVQKIQSAIGSLPVSYQNQFDLLFSAHSLPMKLIKKGDPYPFHIQQTMDCILKKIIRDQNNICAYLSYQSKTRFIHWLEPSTLEVLQRLSQRPQKRAVIIVPISFVSDHVETLYEIDIFYKKEAQKLGFPYFTRVESLNMFPLFISALEDIVLNSYSKMQYQNKIDETPLQ